MPFYIIAFIFQKLTFLRSKKIEYTGSRTDAVVLINFVYPYVVLIFLVSLGENCVF